MRQAFACHMACLYRLMQSFGTSTPAHWGPQAPLDAAPSLAREFEARVAVTGKACGLSGQAGGIPMERGRAVSVRFAYRDNRQMRAYVITGFTLSGKSEYVCKMTKPR